MTRVVVALGVAVVAAAASGAGAPVAAASPPLRMMVSPHSGPSPALVRVQVMVEPSSDNRVLRLMIDSDDYHRSSWIELNGASAERVRVADFRSVPAGVHDVSAALLNDRGEVRATVHDRIRIYD
jgi:hypothetical protein